MVLDFTSATISDTLAARGFTFTRSGATATRVNSSGVLETVAANTLRIDHDPTTLACLGGLFEEASTNYALHSATFTNAAWVKTNVTAAQTQTGPDGVANSASLLTATAANGTALQALTRASAARISSVYVKRVTGSGNVDVTQDNGTTWATVTVTSGWTRVSIASATAANPTVGLRIVTPGDEVAVFGFQHEEKAFVTSYIPTSTAAVTRNADALRCGTLGSWFVQTSGTLLAHARKNVSGSGMLAEFGNSGPNTDRYGVNVAATLAIQAGSTIAGVSDYAGTVNSVTVGTSFKAAGSFDVTGKSSCLNGGTVATSATGIVTSTLMDIGRATWGGAYLNGHISRIEYYPRRLTNAELQALTT